MAKLTQSDVDAIVQLVNEGHQKKDIAARFNVTTTPINAILRGTHALSPFKQVKEQRVSEYQRCGECGSKVLLPCMHCAMLKDEPVEKLPRVVIPR